ncbi:MAG: dehypoxanthine futalosine cyclase [Elusimicrobia bacterium]|jgi:cyclic dehypoxanthinyl futalosine synthase|nr:MAG: dehypoxanthine futalosine cyclase [Elusimicrobiota bacterium]
MTLSWEVLEEKAKNGRRLSTEEGLFLLTEEAPLLELGALANVLRDKKNPGNEVSFVIDTNPNYTNICDTDCLFCAFYRRPKDPDAYALTVDQVMEKVAAAAERGATTVLLQGGHNRALPFDYYLSLIRETRRRFPGVTPHFFSASEVQTMASVSGQSVDAVLRALWDAGQRTLPGGGAEVLSERVRQKLAHKKGGPEKWLEVHRAAHKIGFRSTATMMYGHVETPADIVEHWERIRALQDETGGFTAFIPWSFKPDHTVLERRHPERTGPVPYLRMLAASRVFLDNFDHVQASWFSEGKKAGQASLHFGADDFGGTLIDENVHAAAGFVNKAGVDEVKTLIREAGFTPVQRTTLYEAVPA